MCFCCRVFYRYSTQNVGTTTAQQSPKVVKLEQSKNIQRRQLRHLTKCYEHQWSLSWVFASNAWQELRWLLAWTFLGLCSCSSRDFLLSKSQETQADAFQWPSALSFRCFFAKAPYNWIAYMDRWIRFHTAFLFGNDRTLYSKMTAYDSRKLSQLFTPGDRCIFPVRPLQKPKEMGIGANKSRKFLGRRSFCGCHLWWFEFRSIVWYCNCVCSFLQCLVFERYTQRFTTSQLYVSECKCEMSYIVLLDSHVPTRCQECSLGRALLRNASDSYWRQLIFLGILLGDSQFQYLRNTRHHETIYWSGLLPNKRIKFG